MQSAQTHEAAPQTQEAAQSGAGVEDQVVAMGEEDLQWDTDEEDAKAVSSSFRYTSFFMNYAFN